MRIWQHWGRCFVPKKGRLWKCSLFTPDTSAGPPSLPAPSVGPNNLDYDHFDAPSWVREKNTLVLMLCISRRASLLAVGLLNLTVCCVGLASCTSWFILRDNLRTVGDDFWDGFHQVKHCEQWLMMTHNQWWVGQKAKYIFDRKLV